MTKERSLINLKEGIDYTKEPIFFGEPLNIERYDVFRYPNIDKMTKRQLESFWRPEEVDTTKDRNDYGNLSDNEKFIFTSNLKYQILLDSVQSRGIPNLVEYMSNPESEAFSSFWAAFETLHSLSYSHIIKEVYPKSSDVFDNIMNDEQIIKRTVSVTKYYDDLMNTLDDEDEEEKKTKLLLTLMSVNILEGIRFYVSFACSWAFAENGKMEGNAKIIKFIARDENLHLGFTQFILKQLRTNEEEGFTKIWKKNEKTLIKMFKDAAEEEMRWAEYLFKDGSMLGLNTEILTIFMKYLVNERMKVVGLEPIFEKTKNPIPWVNTWLDGNVQVAPQQSQITSYNVGGVKSDLSSTDFGEFEL